jgi:hypothetical protein
MDISEDYFKRNDVEGYRVLHDEADGVTEESLAFFEKHKGDVGEVLDIFINQDRTFAMEINAPHTTMLLSGVNCGYGGTGPRGTLKLLEMLGLKVAEDYITGNDRCHIDCRGKGIFW